MIKPGRLNNRYYKFLVSPEGVIFQDSQDIGLAWNFVDYSGQAVFSPDGAKYARVNRENHLSVFDFDRCTGTLSNPLILDVPLNDTVNACGVAFSPNSRYLYLTYHIRIFQYDLHAPDVEASKIKITESVPWSTNFYMSLLGPDGKIYIAPPGSFQDLHIIHEPDSAGLACNIELMAMHLPTKGWYGLPYYSVNFRLGALEGSPCDTLDMVDAAKEIIPTNKVEVFPNPSFGTIQLKMEKPLSQNGQFMLYDSGGKLIFNQIISKGSQSENFDFQQLPKGIYFYEIQEKNLRTGFGKVVLVN